MKRKELILYFISISLLLLVFLIVINHLQSRNYISLLWLCYTNMTLIAIGILIKKPNLILSQAIIIALPDFLWVVDFFSVLITGNSQLGITNFFNKPLFLALISLQHFFTVPEAIFALKLMKAKKNYKKSLIIGFVEVLLVLAIMMIIPGNKGINCLPTPAFCTIVSLPNFIPYPIIWLVLEFSFIAISYILITRFLNRKKK